jgi:hypothetical protein
MSDCREAVSAKEILMRSGVENLFFDIKSFLLSLKTQSYRLAGTQIERKTFSQRQRIGIPIPRPKKVEISVIDFLLIYPVRKKCNIILTLLPFETGTFEKEFSFSQEFTPLWRFGILKDVRF